MWKVLSVVVVLLAVGLYGLIEFSPIKPSTLSLPPLPTLESNTKLLHAEHLFEGDWIGPETLTLDPAKKLLYTGLTDGRIVRWDGKTKEYELFVRTGEALPSCGAHEYEHLCGRPMGLHFNSSGHLFVADAYKGILSISPEGHINELTDGPKEAPCHWVNDLAIADDGTIYFTDSSTYERREFLYELLDTTPRGRLLAYYPNGTTKVLAEGFYFANGMTWHHDKQSLLIAELNKARISRYHIATGKVEVFSDNLPGTPDNIRPKEVNGKRTYTVGMPVRRSTPFSLTQTTAPLPYLRAILANLPPWILLSTIPPWGLIGELDENGVLINSYQDPSGRTAALSESLEWNGYMYVGSLLNPFLGRVSLSSF